MLSCTTLKKYGHFELRKAIVKNPIFGVKMSIKQNQSVFACTYKRFEVDFDHGFYDPKNSR